MHRTEPASDEDLHVGLEKRLWGAIHGLSGDIRQGNTYYEDLHGSVGRFNPMPV